jgi:hypothetical protein
MKTFVEVYLDGEASLDDIDNYIHNWHNTYKGDNELHEFLGLTLEEYARWVENPYCLKGLLEIRRLKKLGHLPIGGLATIHDFEEASFSLFRHLTDLGLPVISVGFGDNELLVSVSDLNFENIPATWRDYKVIVSKGEEIVPL